MSTAYRCNGCGSFVAMAALRIERTDNWDGGGGIRINKGTPWDLCKPCAQAIDGALAGLAAPPARRTTVIVTPATRLAAGTEEG